MLERLDGQVIGGCRIIQQVGKGGMSTIYLARQVSVGRDVVLKILAPSLLSDDTFMERFTREVETTARLQHPHIIPIYDYGQHEGLPYIVMACIQSGSLDQLIKREKLALAPVVRIISQVAEALSFAHSCGVIHRDVKPPNILLDVQQNAILSDFGVARVISETQGLTGDVIVGTPFYIAPEMLSDDCVVTPSVDIYALGVTLFQALAGKPPFAGHTTAQIMWAHVNAPVPLLAEARPDLSPEVDVVIQKALAKTPFDRYHTVAEMVDDLAALATDRMPKSTHQVTTMPTFEHLLHARDMQDAVHRALNQVVKISRPDGGTGTGIYLPGNQVMSCLHVIDGSPGIYVTFRTGEKIEADVVAADNQFDLALLLLRSAPASLTREQLDGIVLHAEAVEPGDALTAIGHPLGLDWSVTGGHYNALRQPGEEPLPRFGIALTVPLVQVDVVINAGNSGGPIIDAQGHLIGLADSIINPAVANSIGFAIEGQSVLDFWQQHKEDAARMVAYTCRHHHVDGDQYCPLSGKPIQKIPPIPMPTADAVRYSCGHIHEPGLEYCPLLGKPAYEIDEPPEKQADAVQATMLSPACTNCGSDYPITLEVCPKCGKPRAR